MMYHDLGYKTVSEHIHPETMLSPAGRFVLVLARQ